MPQQKLEDVLRAEAAGSDLEETPEALEVWAETIDGRRYRIGCVDRGFCRRDPAGAMAAVNRLKFRR